MLAVSGSVAGTGACGATTGTDFSGEIRNDGASQDGTPDSFADSGVVDVGPDVTSSDAAWEMASIDSANVEAMTRDAVTMNVGEGASPDSASESSIPDSQTGSDAGMDAATSGDAIADGAEKSDSSADSGQDAGDAAADSSPTTCSPATHSGSSAVAFQIDPQHSGAQPGDVLTLPLCERWTSVFSSYYEYISTPVIANGLVYVIASPGEGQPGVFALDDNTGLVVWGPVNLPTENSSMTGGVALDGSYVFAVDGAGVLGAFDATTGAMSWQTTLTGQYSWSSPPVALDGLVVVNGGGIGDYTYGVRESDGTLLWTYMASNDDSSPAMIPGAVFLHDDCGAAYRISTTDGTLVWTHPGNCSTLGEHSISILDDQLYVGDTFGIGPAYGYVIDPTTGNAVGIYDSGYTPAGSGGVGYFVPHPSMALAAVPFGTSTPSWVSGSNVTTSPIVVGPNVVVGTYTDIEVFSVVDGSLVSSFPLESFTNDSDGLPGLQEADGILFVVTGSGSGSGLMIAAF
jgi:hypothetical protein